MKSVPRPFVLCDYNAGGAPPLKTPPIPLLPLPQLRRELRGALNLPLLGKGDHEVVDEANTIQRRAMMPKELLRRAQDDRMSIIPHS